MTEPVKPVSGVEAAPTKQYSGDFWHDQYISFCVELCEACGTPTDTFAANYVGTVELLKRVKAALSPETPAMPKLVTVIERIANCGSVEDFTVAGIRAELRNALHQYRYGASVETPREEK